MNRLKLKTPRDFCIFPLTFFVLMMLGCATTKTLPVDLLTYKNRAKSSINEDVTVTVAVPTISEAQALYGVNLASKYIQPVWLEVKNDSDDIYWFLPSGLDPDYFFPSEAAFVFKTDNENFHQPVCEGKTDHCLVIDY